MGRTARILGRTATALAALVVAAPAEAAFPGTNGPIAFSQGVQAPPADEDLGFPAQVFTVAADGTGLTQLTHVADDQTAAMPDISADGKRIVYESNESGPYEIWSMNIDGSGQTQLTDFKGAEAFTPSWAPDGQRIVFSKCSEPLGFPAFCDIAVMNADGTGVKKLVGGRRYNIAPEFSPSGSAVVFQSDRAGLIAAVWSVRADGSKLKRVTKPRLEAFWPDWAPGGEKILFADNWDRPHSTLYTVSPSGKDAKRLGKADRGFAAYAPDGEHLVYARGSVKGSKLVTANADGSSPQQVVSLPGEGPPIIADWGPAP